MHTSSLCIELAVKHVAMPCNLVDTYKSVICTTIFWVRGEAAWGRNVTDVDKVGTQPLGTSG